MKRAMKSNEQKLAEYDLIIRCFDVFNIFDGPPSSCLLWRIDDGKLTLFIDCSDLFAWGGADAESITADNITILEQAVLDIKAIQPDYMDAHLLFCCRVRGMRPQKPYYKEVEPAIHHLFDACGEQCEPH